MVKGDTKCFAVGSSAPALNLNRMILYSMRFCPFAEHIRIILDAKNLEYDIININLRSKPDWFMARNPLGKVPTIEEPGHLLTFESETMAEYLDDKFDSGLQILPKDPYLRAQQKMLLEIIWEKFLENFGKAQFFGGEKNEKAVVAGLAEVDSLLVEPYFSGTAVGYVDIMVWPWMSRIPNLKDLRGIEIPKDLYPNVAIWIDRMYELPLIKSTVYPAELVVKFAKDYIEGRPNYDCGL